MVLRIVVTFLLCLASCVPLLAQESAPPLPQLASVRVGFVPADSGPSFALTKCGNAALRAEPHLPADAATTPYTESLLFTDEPPAPAHLSLQKGTWTLHFESDVCWAPERPLILPGTEELSLPIHRTGSLHVETLLGQHTELPTALKATFYFRDAIGNDAPGPSTAGGQTSCSATDTPDQFLCILPQGDLDLKLSAPGVAAHYYWSVTVSPGATRRLDPWRLEPGGSATGWVTSSHETQDVADATVVLKRHASGRARNREEERRLNRSGDTTQPTPKGFFQFSGLTDGTYVVEARQGAAQAGPFRFTVVAGKETTLTTPLELEPPFDLVLDVEPPHGPTGAGWRVELAHFNRTPGRYAKPEQKLTDPSTGRVTFADIRSGEYALWLKDKKGTTWWFEQVMVFRESPSHFVHLDFIEVCGTLELGTEPLEALLHFGGERGSVSLQATSSEEGTFTLLVPREGRWEVDIASDEPTIKRHLQTVDISYNPVKGCAPVELSLPDTLVRGVVLDEADEPVHPALVHAAPVEAGQVEPPAELTTINSDGIFELRGYPEGSLVLSAHVPGKSSDQQVVYLDEDRDAPWVELVLKEHQIVKGRVLTPQSSPLPGVKVFVRGVDAIMAITNHTTTKVDGTFELELSPPSDRVILSVLPAGYSMTTTLASNISQIEPVIRVSNLKGQLDLVMAQATYTFADEQRPVLFNEDGLGIDLWILHQWATLNGAGASTRTSVLTLPAMEPGTYTACMVGIAEALALPPEAIPATGCERVFLAPGSSEQLVLTEP